MFQCTNQINNTKHKAQRFFPEAQTQPWPFAISYKKENNRCSIEKVLSEFSIFLSEFKLLEQSIEDTQNVSKTSDLVIFIINIPKYSQLLFFYFATNNLSLFFIPDFYVLSSLHHQLPTYNHSSVTFLRSSKRLESS